MYFPGEGLKKHANHINLYTSNVDKDWSDLLNLNACKFKK